MEKVERNGGMRLSSFFYHLKYFSQFSNNQQPHSETLTIPFIACHSCFNSSYSRNSIDYFIVGVEATGLYFAYEHFHRNLVQIWALSNLIPLCKDSLIFTKLLGIGQMLVGSSQDDRSCWKLSNSSCHGEERLWSDLVNTRQFTLVSSNCSEELCFFIQRRGTKHTFREPLKSTVFDLPSIQLEFKENFEQLWKITFSLTISK